MTGCRFEPRQQTCIGARIIAVAHGSPAPRSTKFGVAHIRLFGVLDVHIVDVHSKDGHVELPGDRSHARNLRWRGPRVVDRFNRALLALIAERDASTLFGPGVDHSQYDGETSASENTAPAR
jgi:hypothetical protein